MNTINELDIPYKYKKFIRELVGFMQSDERVERLLLFGSCARSAVNAASDVDIAVITKRKLSDKEEMDFYDYLFRFDADDYIACDLLIMSKDQYEARKNANGYVQKYICRDGVELLEPIRTRAQLA